MESPTPGGPDWCRLGAVAPRRPREYEVTNGPVANERRSQAEDEVEGTES
ncbi:hypothetical protein NKG94_47430 [Micromonospora sp. M12]